MFARSIILPGLVASAIALSAPAARAQMLEAPPGTIVIVGEAEQSGTPDIAIVTLGVSRDAETASAALRATNEAMRAVIDIVRKRGVAPRDIQTGNVSLSPRYRPSRPGDERPVIVGYVASNQLALRSRDVGALGALLDEVVAAGSNELRGLSFDVADRARLLDEARVRAVEDAKRKAALLATAAGVQLGEIVNILDEPGAAPARPMAARTEALMTSVPIEAGEVGLRARVRVIWRIAK